MPPIEESSETTSEAASFKTARSGPETQISTALPEGPAVG